MSCFERARCANRLQNARWTAPEPGGSGPTKRCATGQLNAERAEAESGSRRTKRRANPARERFAARSFAGSRRSECVGCRECERVDARSRLVSRRFRGAEGVTTSTALRALCSVPVAENAPEASGTSVSGRPRVGLRPSCALQGARSGARRADHRFRSARPRTRKGARSGARGLGARSGQLQPRAAMRVTNGCGPVVPHW